MEDCPYGLDSKKRKKKGKGQIILGRRLVRTKPENERITTYAKTC
jgi:hypothetical protein